MNEFTPRGLNSSFPRHFKFQKRLPELSSSLLYKTIVYVIDTPPLHDPVLTE